jgi:glycyl-tRNA synthetase beta subunit
MDSKQIENIFTYHAPKGTQQERYVRLRDKAKELAHLINADCPESREKSISLTQLQQCVQMANASIAINE